MKIETQRLIIKALDEKEMKKYVLDNFSLEISLQLKQRPRIITDRIRTTIETKILPNLIGKIEKDLYYTFWIVINKEKNTMVADICFKGEPNEKGEVEIGYGTYPEFQLKGFMTEAIGGLINWTFKQNNITAILAETDPTNYASMRILEKNNFNIDKQTKENINWRLNKKR